MALESYVVEAGLILLAALMTAVAGYIRRKYRGRYIEVAATLDGISDLIDDPEEAQEAAAAMRQAQNSQAWISLSSRYPGLKRLEIEEDEEETRNGE